MKTKKKNIETYIFPSVLYGSETITWEKELLSKVKVFQNDVMRACLNKRRIDRISIADLRDKTGLLPISCIINRRKLSWYGHFKHCDLPVRTIFEGMISGKRKRGRSIRRWRDDIKEWTNLNVNELNTMVKCRNVWRNYISNM